MSDAAHSSHLGETPRRAVSPASARRRSAFIHRLRWVLWSAAALLAVIIVLVIAFSGGAPAPTVDFEADDGAVRMENPRFTGRDAVGNPIIVTAQQALRRPGDNPNVTELALPRLQIDPDNENPDTDPTAASAARGVYDSEARTLELIADVDLTTRSGYGFRTSRATVDLETKDAEGDQPVEASGPMGTISAKRWRFEEDGRVLHFEGDVQTVLVQDKESPAPPEEAAAPEETDQ